MQKRLVVDSNCVIVSWSIYRITHYFIVVILWPAGVTPKQLIYNHNTINKSCDMYIPQIWDDFILYSYTTCGKLATVIFLWDYIH